MADILLSQLQSHNGAHGNSMERETRLKWYQLKMIVKELTCTDNHGGEDELTESIDHQLMIVEGKQLVESSKSDILGITSALLTPTRQERQESGHREILLRKRFQDKLTSLSEFYQPSPLNSGPTLLKAKAIQFLETVKRDLEVINTNRRELIELKQKECFHLQSLLKLYASSLRYLDEILVNYKLEKQHEIDKTNCMFLKAEATASQAKLSMVVSEILEETYSPHLVAELKTMRDDLDTKLAATQAALNKAESAYRACLSAGREFEQIAKEYGQTKKDIEDRKWALEEIKLAKQAGGI